MAEKHVFIFICGVGNHPGEAKNWTGKAVTHCHTELETFAEKIEYYVNPLLRPMGEQERAEKTVKTIQRYLAKGFTVSIGTHSNGADVALDALALMGWPRIKELHMIAPACKANWNENGLNVGWVSFERIVVYIAGQDAALEAADTFLGRALGYGTLGQGGPIEPSGNIQVVIEPDFGHSTWFDAANFGQTMRRITTPTTAVFSA
ncbi:MAG: hypothetical protein WA003_15785 [Desulfuromonadaceae bacterium]